MEEGKIMTKKKYSLFFYLILFSFFFTLSNNVISTDEVTEI